jgi:hypothetical protein
MDVSNGSNKRCLLMRELDRCADFDGADEDDAAGLISLLRLGAVLGLLGDFLMETRGMRILCDCWSWLTEFHMLMSSLSLSLSTGKS